MTDFSTWMADYNSHRREQESQFKTNNQTNLSPHTVSDNQGCLDSYPMFASTYNQGIHNSFHLMKNDEPLEYVPQFFKEGFTNESRINDPTEDLLDIPSRPLSDFVHNNMVPFYKGSVKQNMAGTGVPSGNYTDGVDVDSGFDNSTPYQHLLGLYTGMDDTYLHKREAGPMFSPAEQQTTWAATRGMPDFRPDLDRYKQGMHVRNDMVPVEPQMVGKGLALDPSIPASGGFNEMTRVMPNNVNAYKANQLPGRVVTQKFQLGGEEPEARPTDGVPKNRPERYWDQVRLPTMTTRVGFQDSNFEFVRPDYDTSKKPRNAVRSETNYGFGSIVKNN